MDFVSPYFFIQLHYRYFFLNFLTGEVYGLQEEDYRRFEESLEDDNKEDDHAEDKKAASTNDIKRDKNNNEVRVGIKNW